MMLDKQLKNQLHHVMNQDYDPIHELHPYIYVLIKKVKNVFNIINLKYKHTNAPASPICSINEYLCAPHIPPVYATPIIEHLLPIVVLLFEHKSILKYKNIIYLYIEEH